MIENIINSYNIGLFVKVMSLNHNVVTDFYFPERTRMFENFVDPYIPYLFTRPSVEYDQHEVTVSDNTSFKSQFSALVASEDNCRQAGNSFVCGLSIHLSFDLGDVISKRLYSSTLSDTEAIEEIIAWAFGEIDEETGIPMAFAMLKSNHERVVDKRSQTFYSMIKSKSSDKNIRKIQDRINNIESEIRTSSANIERLYSDLDNCKLLLFGAQESRKRLSLGLKESFVQLMGMQGSAFESINIQKDGFSYVTNSIFVYHNDDLYKFGSFLVEVSFRAASSVKVSKWKNNSEAGGYIHPHLSQSGHPCWGNIHDSAFEALGSKDYVEIIALINNLLSSYSSSNPYIRIEDFESHSGSTSSIFDNCMSTAIAIDDCIYCDRTMCPQHATRYDRCFNDCIMSDDHDDVGLNDCVQCNMCDYAAQAIINLDGTQAEVTI